jgi:uncharacterized RDD family membrane protein YckC
MRFLAFPAVGLCFLLLWGAGLSATGAIALAPAVAFFLLAILLPLIWPVTPKKKQRGPQVRILREEERRRSPRPPR